MDYLHCQYHTLNSPFEKYEWFCNLKKLHHLHHKKKYKNYNLLIFLADKTNNSYLNQ